MRSAKASFGANDLQRIGESLEKFAETAAEVLANGEIDDESRASLSRLYRGLSAGAAAVQRGADRLSPERSAGPPQNRLAKLYGSSGLTRQQFAVAIGVSPTTVRRWETGRIPPDRTRELAARFGVDVSYLMGWDVDSASESRAS